MRSASPGQLPPIGGNAKAKALNKSATAPPGFQTRTGSPGKPAMVSPLVSNQRIRLGHAIRAAVRRSTVRNPTNRQGFSMLELHEGSFLLPMIHGREEPVPRDEDKQKRVKMMIKKLRTQSVADSARMALEKARRERELAVSYEKQMEVGRAFRKYSRTRPGEVVFDEVQAMLRDMRTFITDEQLEAFVGLNFADLRRIQELSTPIGIDYDSFQDLYLGVQDIEEGRKNGTERSDIVGTLEDLSANAVLCRNAFEELDRGKKGYLVFSELRDFVNRYGFRVPPGMKPVEFIGKMFKKADVDNSSTVDYREFVNLIEYIIAEAKNPFGPL